jgi:ribosome-associated protein
MDYVDFIVHVFSAEKRAHYGLERLRKSATTISVAELSAELKALIASTREKTSEAAAALVKTAPKTAAKKAAAKKAPAKKVPAKKSAAKKTPAKKTPAKKTPARKIKSARP